MKTNYKDLVQLLLDQLYKERIAVTKILSDANNFIKAVRVNNITFLTKYANQNVDGRYWFGFMTDEVEEYNSHLKCQKVLLVIGLNCIDRIYSTI